MATSEQIEVHSSKRKYFHLGYFYVDPQGKRWCFSTPQTVPYLLPSSPRDHAIFFRSQSSTSNEFLCTDEDGPSSRYSSPIHRWIDHSFGYTFRQDDRVDGFSFQQDFLPPAHLHKFYSMISYMSIYTHDFYVLDLSLLFHMIKHRGKYLHSLIRWLHWLYNFT
jgi:hypothetical protein